MAITTAASPEATRSESVVKESDDQTISLTVEGTDGDPMFLTIDQARTFLAELAKMVDELDEAVAS
jgi:hypothetical protein